MEIVEANLTVDQGTWARAVAPLDTTPNMVGTMVASTARDLRAIHQALNKEVLVVHHPQGLTRDNILDKDFHRDRPFHRPGVPHLH